MANEIQVPIGLSGFITKIDGVNFCMDGATHYINSQTSSMRLKGKTDEVTDALNNLVGANTQVLVMGYQVWTAECMHLYVYHIALTEEVNKALGGDGSPWPYGGDGIPWPYKLIAPKGT